MKQQIDVKARAILIVWNLMLTVAMIAMSFRLAEVGPETNAVFEEQLVLMEEMIEADEHLATLSERHSILIADLFGYMDNVQKLTLSDNTRITGNNYAIEEIYRLHIIPLRSFHMESED